MQAAPCPNVTAGVCQRTVHWTPYPIHMNLAAQCVPTLSTPHNAPNSPQHQQQQPHPAVPAEAAAVPPLRLYWAAAFPTCSNQL